VKGDREKSTVAAGYDAIVGDYVRWSARVIDPARDRLFDRWFTMMPQGSRVLDLGCGSGVPWTRVLAERFDVTGIDISPLQVAAARENVPGATFVVGDMASIALEDASFGGAVALYSLGHLPPTEHRVVFERLARWLRPGGLLLASLPADASPGWIGPWLGTSMYFASLGAGAYRSLLPELGWTVLEAEVAVVEEPEGPARFLWVLARSPG
jgi:SAM-dependent methyltransferase